MPSSINRQLRDKGLEPVEITIHLKYQVEVVQYHCLICCKGTFRQQGRIINVFMADDPDAGDMGDIMTVPVSIQCHRCGAIYHLATLNR